MKLWAIMLVMLSAMLMSGTSFASSIDINKASVKELQSVKGIGPKTAQAIVKYRKEHGKFSSVSDLKNVKGIGDKKLKMIKQSLKGGESTKPAAKGKKSDNAKKKKVKDKKGNKSKKDKKHKKEKKKSEDKK